MTPISLEGCVIIQRAELDVFETRIAKLEAVILAAKEATQKDVDLDSDEVAERLGRHPETVREYCRKGEINAMKMGKAWIIKQSALEEFTKRKLRKRGENG